MFPVVLSVGYGIQREKLGNTANTEITTIYLMQNWQAFNLFILGTYMAPIFTVTECFKIFNLCILTTPL